MSNITTCRPSKINGRQSISGDYNALYLPIAKMYVNADMFACIC